MLDTVKDDVFKRKTDFRRLQYANPLHWLREAFRPDFDKGDKYHLHGLGVAGSGKNLGYRTTRAAAGLGVLAVWSLFGTAAYKLAGNVADAIQSNMAKSEQPPQNLYNGQRYFVAPVSSGGMPFMPPGSGVYIPLERPALTIGPMPPDHAPR